MPLDQVSKKLMHFELRQCPHQLDIPAAELWGLFVDAFNGTWMPFVIWYDHEAS